MKFFIILFSIYFLSLPLVPCSDIHDSCNSVASGLIQSQSHNHCSGTDDVCSPFCVCNCCSTSVTVYAGYYSPTNLYLLENKIIPALDILYLSDYYGNIWQPPKIS